MKRFNELPRASRLAFYFAYDGLAVVGGFLGGLFLSGAYPLNSLLTVDSRSWLPYLLLLAAVVVLGNLIFGVYSKSGNTQFGSKASALAATTTISFLVLAVAISFTRELNLYKAFAYGFSWVLVTGLLCAGRFDRHQTFRQFLRNSFMRFKDLPKVSELIVRFVYDGLVAVVGFLGGLFLSGAYPVDSLFTVDSRHWLPYLLLLATVIVLTNVAFGVYGKVRSGQLRNKVSALAASTTVSFLVLAVAISFTRELNLHKAFAYGFSWVLVTGLLCAGRLGRHQASMEVQRDFAQKMSREREGRVLVIGGGGYIGTALVPKLLAQGYEVVVLDKLYFGEEPVAGFRDHPKVTIVRDDFRDVAVLVRLIRSVGALVHLGGLVGDPACAVDPEFTIDVNVTSTRLIGEIAKANGIRRFLFASSCSVYGASPNIVDEDSAFNPQSLYAQTKVASEAVLTNLYDGVFCPTMLRFATIYGLSGRTRFDLVVNLLSAKAIQEGKITIFGGDQWRPWVHVDDVAQAVLTTLQAPLDLVANQAFNVGSNDQNTTLLEMGERVKKLVPDAEIIVSDDDVDKRNYRVNFDKIRRDLGFVPKWCLEDGIKQIIHAIASGQVRNYTGAAYSNVKFLREVKSDSIIRRYNTGWESSYLAKIGGATIGGGANAPVATDDCLHSLPGAAGL